MRVTERELNKYLKQIKKHLVCKGAQRKAFMDSFEDNIDEYLKANSEADFAQLQKDMGTPEEIADGFLENESASHIKKRMSIAKWVAVGIAAVVVIYVCAVISALIDAHNSHNGRGYVTVPKTITNEDGSTEVVTYTYEYSEE